MIPIIGSRLFHRHIHGMNERMNEYDVTVSRKRCITYDFNFQAILVATQVVNLIRQSCCTVCTATNRYKSIVGNSDRSRYFKLE